MKLLRKPLVQIRWNNWHLSLTFFWLLMLIVFVPLFARLGFWQLERAAERELAQVKFQASISRDAIPLAEIDFHSNQSTYIRTQVTGTFDWSKQFIVTGKVHNTISGYEILTPLILSDGRAILVSRGWLPPSPGKTPNITPPNSDFDRVDITGLAVKPAAKMAAYQKEIAVQSKQFRAEEETLATTSWPMFVDNEDIEKMAVSLELELVPRILQPEPNKFSYMRVWKPASRSATVNYGYAAQWFGLMSLLIGSALYLNTSRLRPTEDNYS